MENLQIYNGTPSNFEQALALAKMFAESGMFEGGKQIQQAMVKVQAGAELGITPYAAMSGIHIISGKPVLGAGLIAAKIRQSGRYDYTIKKHDNTVCTVEIVEIRGAQRVSVGTETFTIEDARKAGTKNLDKFPKNMLYARAMSNAAKFYCPDIFNGAVYVQEDFETETTVETTAKVVESNPVAAPAPTPQAEPAPQANEAKVVPPTGKQHATLKSLLTNGLFTPDEVAAFENAMSNADTNKAKDLITRVSAELSKRQKAEKPQTIPVQPVAENTEDQLPNWATTE